jgi:hypothetical protein
LLLEYEYFWMSSICIGMWIDNRIIAGKQTDNRWRSIHIINIINSWLFNMKCLMGIVFIIRESISRVLVCIIRFISNWFKITNTFRNIQLSF